MNIEPDNDRKRIIKPNGNIRGTKKAMERANERKYSKMASDGRCNYEVAVNRGRRNIFGRF